MKNFSLIATAIVSLTLSLLVPLQVAHADAFATWADSTFKADSAYLNTDKSIQIDLTPLQTGTKMWRYLNVNWKNEDSSHRYGGQAGISSQSGNTSFTFAFYAAVDVQFSSAGINSGSCGKYDPYEFAGKSYFQAICSTPFNITQGHTYRIKMLNDSKLGTSWFKATIDDLVDKSHAEIGSINVGDKSFSSPLSLVQYGMHDSTPSTGDCSRVEINDTIFSAVTSGSNTYSTFLGQSSDACAKAVVIANKYSLGGNVIKFGGTNAASRNLESTAALNSASTVQRVARATSEVPHPAELSPGLIQNRYTQYFADTIAIFDTPPSSSVTVETLPEYTSSTGVSSAFSNNWTGYIIPDHTGTWTFRMTSDDSAYLYIGDNAVIGYARDIHSALIDLAGTHEAITKTATVDFVKDKIYPFRIMYGNALSLSVFKLEFKAAGFTDFQSDYKSLFWHSTPGPCTNWGMDYVFSGDLGFEKVAVHVGTSLPDCPRNYGNTNFAPVYGTGSGATSGSSTSTKKTVVNKPSFSLVNIVGNKLNINVNLGSAASSRPDTVYLVAPKLGILDSNKLFGNVLGSKASWSIDFDKLLSGTAIPLKVVGVKDGIESDAVTQDFNAPAAIDKLLTNKSAPAAPKNVKSRVVGTSALISAEATVKSGALATQAFVFGPSIGLSKVKAITGDIVGNKVLLEIPLKSSMAGKKLPVTIYLSNEVGDSQPVQTVIIVPAAPKIPSGSIKLPTQTKAPKTIFCVKGSQTRTFAAKACPPGWKTA